MSVENGRKMAAKLATNAVMDWIDVDSAKHTVNECLAFAKKGISVLNQADLSETPPKDVSQMIINVVKALDEAARLVQYSQGQPDSRAEITIGQLFAVLSPEEVSLLRPALQRLQDAQDTGEPKNSQLH